MEGVIDYCTRWGVLAKEGIPGQITPNPHSIPKSANSPPISSKGKKQHKGVHIVFFIGGSD